MIFVADWTVLTDNEALNELTQGVIGLQVVAWIIAGLLLFIGFRLCFRAGR